MSITAAALTPVPAAEQDEALYLYTVGEKTKALKALRKDSDLPLAYAPAALELLLAGALPKTVEEAGRILSGRAPALHEALITKLRSGERLDALRILRKATGVGIVTAKRLIEHLLAPPQPSPPSQ
ncbi:hypothetical protein ACIPUC_13475 [Streptomyces sp. LARHCF249]